MKRRDGKCVAWFAFLLRPGACSYYIAFGGGIGRPSFFARAANAASRPREEKPVPEASCIAEGIPTPRRELLAHEERSYE